MTNVDIMDAVQQGIENVIFKAWRHNGCIGSFNSESVRFEVDGQEYILRLSKVGGQMKVPNFMYSHLWRKNYFSQKKNIKLEE